MRGKALLYGPFVVLAIAILVVAVVVSQRGNSSDGEPHLDIASLTVIREVVIVESATLSPD